VSKGPEAFRTISEAASEVGVAQHVLRFWETRFSFIRPMKRAGGRRFYRPQDILVLRGVHRLLHDEGYTIAGVQKLYREHGAARLASAGGGEVAGGGPESAPPGSGAAAPASLKAALSAALEELLGAKSRLERALGSKGR
jgi:DNA-binding transcriptional MerR regulator